MADTVTWVDAVKKSEMKERMEALLNDGWTFMGFLNFNRPTAWFKKTEET